MKHWIHWFENGRIGKITLGQSSAAASPVFVVWAKGKPRVVVDLRRINTRLMPDAYPLPKQDDELSALALARYSLRSTSRVCLPSTLAADTLHVQDNTQAVHFASALSRCSSKFFCLCACWSAVRTRVDEENDDQASELCRRGGLPVTPVGKLERSVLPQHRGKADITQTGRLP